MDKATDRTFYDVLLVSPGATNNEVKASYRKLAKQYHPDTGPSADEDEFKVVNDAYQALKTKAGRDAYDRKLANSLAADDASWGNPGGGTAAASASPPRVDIEAEKRRIQLAFATEVSRIRRKFVGLRQRETSELADALAEVMKLVAPPPVVRVPEVRQKALVNAGMQYHLELQEALELGVDATTVIDRYAAAKASIKAEEEAERLHAKGVATKALREETEQRLQTEAQTRLKQLDRDEQRELERAERTRDTGLAAVGAKK